MSATQSAPPLDSRELGGGLEYVACNLCGADDSETLYDAREPDTVRDMVRTFRASGDDLLIDPLVCCRRCGLQYVNPRPRASDIVHAYSTGDDPTYVSQVASRERTFAGAVAHIEKLLPGTGRLFDIGTAAGAFLAAARARGWEVDGCEPNRWTAAWGSTRYGVPIRQGEIFDHDLPASAFDVVTLWDVIEHTPDPSRVIDRVRGLVKPGGLLIVNYPDIGSSIARALGRKWPFLSSVHLYYFTRQTMRRLLERHGFEIVEMRPHIQRLELDYLLSRGVMVSPRVSRWSRLVARLFGLANRQTPYWIGQTFVAARRLALQP
ncbi:MAG: methyltransferase domain-containing protein [Luteitalea sp.]|nr:methyltransferase domain-containing protein [Luteitalea sp.]